MLDNKKDAVQAIAYDRGTKSPRGKFKDLIQLNNRVII